VGAVEGVSEWGLGTQVEDVEDAVHGEQDPGVTEPRVEPISMAGAVELEHHGGIGFQGRDLLWVQIF
jgi:hypothetical protein